MPYKSEYPSSMIFRIQIGKLNWSGFFDIKLMITVPWMRQGL